MRGSTRPTRTAQPLTTPDATVGHRSRAASIALRELEAEMAKLQAELRALRETPPRDVLYAVRVADRMQRHPLRG